MSLTRKQRIGGLVVAAANHLGLLDGFSFLRALIKPQVAILMYHRVGRQEDFSIVPIVRHQDFEKQIAYLCRLFEIMPLDKLAQCVQSGNGLPKRAAVITFDDGYKDNYIYAYPVLKRYKVPATVFLATGHVGAEKPFWWDKVAYVIKNTTRATLELNELGVYHLRSPASRLRAVRRIREGLKRLGEERKEILMERLATAAGVQFPADWGKELILSWDDVKEMNDGGIAFGAHSITHPSLAKLSLTQAEYEIVQSKKDIEERLNRAVTAFCYPYGKHADFNSESKKLVKSSGLACAVTAIPRMIASGIDLYELPRIDPGWNFNTFKASLSGLYPDLKAILGRISPI